MREIEPDKSKKIQSVDHLIKGGPVFISVHNSHQTYSVRNLKEFEKELALRLMRMTHEDCAKCPYAKLDCREDHLIDSKVYSVACGVGKCNKAGWSVHGPLVAPKLTGRKATGVIIDELEYILPSVDQIEEEIDVSDLLPADLPQAPGAGAW